jgi:hypothetical protein
VGTQAQQGKGTQAAMVMTPSLTVVVAVVARGLRVKTRLVTVVVTEAQAQTLILLGLLQHRQVIQVTSQVAEREQTEVQQLLVVVLVEVVIMVVLLVVRGRLILVAVEQVVVVLTTVVITQVTAVTADQE